VVLGWKPMCAECHYFRGVLLFHSDPAAGRRHLEEAYSLRPRKPPITHAYSSLVLQSKAREAFVRGDPEDAIQLSEEAMGVLPEAPDAYHLAATIHGRTGDHGRAVELYRKSIDVARQTTSNDYRRWGVGIFSPVSFYRQALVSALVEEGSPASVTEVVRYLGDEDPTLVRYVLESLADGQFRESVSAIEELLDLTTDDDVRQAATAALGRLKG
jgi:tetratricopeptide (TPR) repeat protein